MDWEDRLEQWQVELDLAERLDGTGWVTLARAEELTGASRSTLRSWYRTGDIRSKVVDGPNGPQRLVPAQDVLDRASRSPHIRQRSSREVALEARLAIVSGHVEALDARVRALEARIH
jgi:predicted site-specific integrase-resolvase